MIVNVASQHSFPSRSVPLTSDNRQKKVFYGWYIVAAGWGINVLVAAAYVLGISLFFNPIRMELGWSAAATSLAFSLRQAETGITSPFTGFLIDRLGSRKMMLVGLTMLGLAFILLGRVQTLWQFYAVFMLMSIGSSIGYLQAVNASLVNWFRRRRVRALGLMLSGASIGGILVPVTALMVTSLGWRTTATISGLAIWAWCLPLATIVRHRPEPYGLAPDGDPPAGEAQGLRAGSTGRAAPAPPSTAGWGVKDAITSRTFWIITLAQASFNLASNMILVVHLVPYLESLGLPRTSAASVVTIFMLSTLPGRLGLGWFGDQFDTKRLLSVLYALSASGIFILTFSHVYWQVVPFAVVAGLARGGITTLTPALISESFGTRRYASINGLMHTFTVATSVAGPFLGGLVFDLTGSYRPAFLVVAIMAALTAPLILLARQPEEVETPIAVATG